LSTGFERLALSCVHAVDEFFFLAQPSAVAMFMMRCLLPCENLKLTPPVRAFIIPLCQRSETSPRSNLTTISRRLRFRLGVCFVPIGWS